MTSEIAGDPPDDDPGTAGVPLIRINTGECLGCGENMLERHDCVIFTAEFSAYPHDHGMSLKPSIVPEARVCFRCWLSPAAGLLRNLAQHPNRYRAPSSYGCIVLCTTPRYWPRRLRTRSQLGKVRKPVNCPGCHQATHVHLIAYDETPSIRARLLRAVGR